MLEHEMERPFIQICIENQWCDDHYAQKVWDQRMMLNHDDRKMFLRKVSVIINSSHHETTLRLAKKIYHELAGFVNDRGAMQSRLTPEKIDSRKAFREETGQPIDEA